MNPHPFISLFEDFVTWQVVASGQAEGKISAINDARGQPGLRLDYDFHSGGGFVAIRRPLPFRLPETFEIGFEMRGHGMPNHFEFKVVDPGGTNVWRHLHQDFTLPNHWTAHRFHERNLPFAWGPAGGGAPSEVGALEFVIAAGPGGKGFLELSGPTFEDQTAGNPSAISASTHISGFPAAAVLDENSPTGWRASSTDSNPYWSVDFGKNLRFGGLIIEWPEPMPPRAFVIEISDNASDWRIIHHTSQARGVRSFISTPAAEASHLRITFKNAACAALRSIKLKPDAFSRTPNEFVHSVAQSYPRGWFPRYWLREQSYWTPIGHQGGHRRALINEEGMVEVDEAKFSLEPFLQIDGKPITWADVKISHSLPKGGAPLPAVVWKTQGATLEILPWVAGSGDNLTLHVTYRLQLTKDFKSVRLLVAIRPFQVNPPWQAFRNLGGRCPIQQIHCGDVEMRVDDRKVIVAPAADFSGASAFEDDCVINFLTNSELPTRTTVNDESAMASALMAWNMPSGDQMLEITLSIPYFEQFSNPSKEGLAEALESWRKTLNTVKWQVPTRAAPAFDCFRTAAAHILINRDGPAIQPGPRRYTRSWVRDCVIMGAALAKAGLPDALEEFLTWYAQFQRDDGFIPCVVDRDGIDWLVEHDSHGQFLWGIREMIRNNPSERLIQAMYPHVRATANYLTHLRAQRMTATYTSYENNACFGLLPESASHEGYLAHPVHSYWDDFWGIRGLEAAADIADDCGQPNDAAPWRNEAKNFQVDVLNSLAKVISNHQLNWIPGSVEWADFDPTATSNAIAMLDFADVLPADPMQAMLETYLDGFRRKHRGEIPWTNYTAYEIRIIGAFVRLGNRAAANELLTFFLSDRRPIEWNQWPEITWRDPRSPGHLGDVPHTWIAAEYLLAVASMVVAEREASGSLVLASGMPWAWISDENGFAVRDLPTRFGKLHFRIHAPNNSTIAIEIGDILTFPQGGIIIAPPLPDGKRIISLETQCGSHSPIDPPGYAIAVTSVPFIATLILGNAISNT
jgi:hypothetical protein